MGRPFLILEDDSEQWFRAILAEHGEEAQQRALSMLEAGLPQPTGCIETGTQTPRKVRYRGRQIAAYRFVFCVLNREIASRDHVVRHRCHNRLCINPDHLVLGSQADNKRDDWEHSANGIDADYL